MGRALDTATRATIVNVSAYERPCAIDEALALLDRPDAVVLGGGTTLNAAPSAEPVLVVDLQALHLDVVEPLGDGALQIGATATLQQLVDDGKVPAGVREAARREAPSTLRTVATVGGCVATADWTSELLAMLLVHEAVVTLVGRDGVRSVELTDLLADGGVLAGRIITAITIDATGVTSAARTGRTPADRAIVAAVARRTTDGKRHLALTGVAATPVLVDGVEDLDPPGDFRGSSEYRRALAATLAARVLEEVG